MERKRSVNRKGSKFLISPCVVVCFLLSFTCVGVASAATYYVAPDGNDSNPGTEAQPWKTIQKAADALTEGDTVRIKAGTYNEMVTPQNSGSPGNYITYTAYPGDTVTIDGTGVTQPYEGIFYPVEKDYIKISGVRLINSAGMGIRAIRSNHLLIEKCYTYNTYQSGIMAKDAVNVIIDSNEVELACNDGDQECITLNGLDGFEVKNNHIHHGGPGTTGGEGIDAKSGSLNGKIFNNYVHDLSLQRLGIYVDAGAEDSYNIDVYNNVIHDCPEGIALATEGGGTLENINVYNNITYNNGNGLSIHKYTCPGSHLKKNIRVINNSFCDSTSLAIQITEYGEHFQDLTIRNNMLSGKNWGMINFPYIVEENVNIDHNFFTGSSNVYGDNHITGDPKFVNPDAADFHLQEDSPAIDHGSSVDAPSDDFDGNPRPQGAGYDIGAYEFGADDTTEETEPEPVETEYAEDLSDASDIDGAESDDFPDASGDGIQESPGDQGGCTCSFVL